jgi:hypothetical protein
MKQIIIFILVLILGFVAYDFYKDWRRFQAPNYEYVSSEEVDLNYHDQSVVWDYEEAIQDVNSFVKQQWTVNDIDVRMPEENDLETKQAVSIYSKKLAKINYFEKKLIQSAQMKKDGATDDQIKAKENNTTIPDQNDSLQTVQPLLELYKNQISISKNIGSKSALIYEIQKLLNAQGYAIPLDGVFAQITVTALADFESKNNLYPDGKIDILSFNALMRR